MYFQNTIIVSAMTTAIVLAAGVIGAYSLTRYAFRGRTLVARVTLLAYMFPPIIMLVPLFLLARQLGLTNSLPRARAHLHLVLAALRALDPPRVLPVHPESSSSTPRSSTAPTAPRPWSTW